jgi:hypothetical protein
MPTSEESKANVQGLRIVQGVFQAAALAALIALGGGGSTTSRGRVGGKGVGVSIHTGVDLSATAEVREIVLSAYNKCADRIRNLMMQEGTKVPKETGLLRSQFNFNVEPDGSAFHLNWPVWYAAHLWERFAPGYESIAGKKRHGEITYPDWSEWAIDVAEPIVLEALREAFEEAGYTVQVS